MIFDITDHESIEYWQNHVGYSGIQYVNTDCSTAPWWGIEGNVVTWRSESWTTSLEIEEIYLGELYTMIVTTTTQRIALWFANSTEVKTWDQELTS